MLDRDNGCVLPDVVARAVTGSHVKKSLEARRYDIRDDRS